MCGWDGSILPLLRVIGVGSESTGKKKTGFFFDLVMCKEFSLFLAPHRLIHCITTWVMSEVKSFQVDFVFL